MKKIWEIISLYIRDRSARLNLSIFLGLILNVLYIFFNLVFGIAYRNVWFITVSAYYSIIVFLRYLVINEEENNSRAALESSKNAGLLMMILGIPVTGIIIYTLLLGISKKYSYLLLLFLGLHSLFTITRSLWSFLRMRGDGVVARAAHSVRLSGALMSVFNFQTAVLPLVLYSVKIRTLLNFITGSLASLCIFALAYGIISDANKELKE
jgi:hypothetical protein